MSDPEARAVVLTGGARAFCTGDDLRAAQRLDVPAFRAQIETLQALASELWHSPTPVIAAVAGPAFGGGLELALNCDVRVAAASARFACPETKWALTITNGSSLLLRRLVGEGWAREIALLGTEVDAETALRIGLVTRVVADRGAPGGGGAARGALRGARPRRRRRHQAAAQRRPGAVRVGARGGAGDRRRRVRVARRPRAPGGVRETMTLDARLAERATTHPDRVFLRFADGDRTFAQVDAAATEMAHALAGVRVVATLLPNCFEAAVLPFAAARAGAVYAPINIAFRGPGLAHVLDISGAELLVVDETRAEIEHLRRVDVRSLRTGDTTPIASPNAEDDLAMLLFTSGTTGRSKGCMLSHRYGPRQAQLLIDHYELRDDDVLYCPFPLFHLDALVLTVLAALELGTTAAIGARFSASGFWDEIRAFGATVFDFMGATSPPRARPGPTTPTTRSGSRGACPYRSGRPSSRRGSACGWPSCTAPPTSASRSTSRSMSRACPGRAAGRSTRMT